jgi:hypothetical protein
VQMIKPRENPSVKAPKSNLPSIFFSFTALVPSILQL